MSLAVLGLNHRTAPIDVRERFHVPEERLGAVLRELRAGGTIEECVVLSTCNRTECYFTAPEEEAAARRAGEVLAGQAGIPAAEAGGHMFRFRGRDTVEHLYRVVSGLDSLVLGEPQIQGQVGDAYRATRRTAPGAVGAVLHRLFQSAQAAGGRVRSQTRLSEGSASVPAAAVELARKVLGPLEERAAMVVGSGDMGTLTARVLRGTGVRRILVASRSLERAGVAAREVGGEAVAHAELWARLPEVDLVVTSTTATAPFITARRLRAARSAREPLVILDIAVPRNVEASTGDLPGVFLYNVDDLQGVIDAAERARSEEVPVAEEIVREHAAKYWSWYRARRAVPLIRSLRERARRLLSGELEAVLDGMELTAEERERIHVASLSALNKILHAPTERLRELAREPAGEERLRLAARLLGIAEPEEGARESDGADGDDGDRRSEADDGAGDAGPGDGAETRVTEGRAE